MAKNTLSTRQLESKLAKKEWLKGMRKIYPNFKKRLWAKDSYRMEHPQPISAI